MNRRWMVISLVFAVAFMIVMSPLNGDIIHRKNGTKIPNVKVINETIKETTYLLEGMNMNQRMDSKTIARVEYVDVPEAYDQAEADRKAGNHESAAGNYQRAIRANAREYPWAKQYAMFGFAESLRAMAEAGKTALFGQAISVYQQLLKEVPGTIHTYKALLGIGNCFLALGKDGEASAVFDQVIKDNYEMGYVVKAEIGKARILESKKQFREAKHKYSDIYKKARSLAMSDPSAKDIPLLARVREAACLVGMRKIDEAQEIFQDLIKNSDSDTVLAGAYNGMGDVYRSRRDLEKAMWAYLKVAIVFEGITSEAPKAFYWASIQMRDMATKLKGDQAKTWKRRGKALLMELRQKFPGSSYAHRK